MFLVPSFFVVFCVKAECFNTETPTIGIPSDVFTGVSSDMTTLSMFGSCPSLCFGHYIC